MPTYDYQCRHCGNTIEVIHSMLEEGPQTCERCGGPLRRILHPAGIIFRGSGFYKTDSRNATPAPSSPSSSDSTPSGSSDASGSSGSSSAETSKESGSKPSSSTSSGT